MRTLVGLVTALGLMLGVAGCAGSPKSESCYPMCASGCTAEGKPMNCGNCSKCEKKEKPACCSSKSGDAKPGEAHEH